MLKECLLFSRKLSAVMDNLQSKGKMHNFRAKIPKDGRKTPSCANRIAVPRACSDCKTSGWILERERESKMAGKINDFVTSSGFNELFSGYNQGFQWQIGCTLGSGELRWGAPSLGMTEALSQKPDL